MDWTGLNILWWWAFANLLVPLLSIGVVVLMMWLYRLPPSWVDAIRDGQVCFYAVAILAAGWYDLGAIAPHYPIDGFHTWIAIIGAVSALGYGMLVADHIGPGWISPHRAAVVSVAVGAAAIFLALRIHWTILAVERGHL